MTEENGGHTDLNDGDRLGRGAERRRGGRLRPGPLGEFLDLEYPAESATWVLRDSGRRNRIGRRLLERLRVRTGAPARDSEPPAPN